MIIIETQVDYIIIIMLYLKETMDYICGVIISCRNRCRTKQKYSMVTAWTGQLGI